MEQPKRRKRLQTKGMTRWLVVIGWRTRVEGIGGLDGWGCLMVSCTLASHANLTTSYKPVSVHSWCRVKCEVSSRQQTVRGEGYERGEGGLPYGKRGRSAVASVALLVYHRRSPVARTILHCFKTWQRRHNSEIK